MRKIDILPTTVYEFKLPDEIYLKLKTTAENINWNELPTRNGEPHYGKSYRPTTLHKSEDYKELVEYIKQQVNKVADEQQYTFLDSLEVSLLWLNKSSRGQWHHRHFHAWSVLSGIIYVKGLSGKTWFSRPTEYNMPTAFALKQNCSEVIYKHAPKLGTGLIFPSKLEHSVDAVSEYDEDRITLSFNTFPKGKVGNADFLAGVNIS
jgi:uncharacterized protein (TIGR02466 family)